MVGELNARHCTWNKVSNVRGRVIIKWERKWNLKVTVTSNSSYCAKGIGGYSCAELILDKEMVNETQPVGGSLVDSSDHTVILYKVLG